MNLINQLQSIEFVCLDVDDEAYIHINNIAKDFEYVKNFMFGAMNARDFVSLRTYDTYQKFLITKEYDDFHLLAHLIFIDKIITFVINGTGHSIETCIEETLRCGNNKELINELYKLLGKKEKRAA